LINASVALLVILLFLMMIMLPLGSDNVVYLRGGQCIAQGGMMYRDYLDLKPPAIYYIMALCVKLVGSTDQAVRIFDITYQLISLSILVFVVRKMSDSIILARINAVVFTIMYICLGMGSSVHCESFAIPLTTLIIYQTWLLSRNTQNKSVRVDWFSWILIGLLTGISAGLKMTFLILAPAVISYIIALRWKQWKYIAVGVCILLSGVALGLCIGYLPLLLSSEERGYFLEMFDYVRQYANQPSWSLALVRHAIRTIGDYFGSIFMLLNVILVVVGFTSIFTLKKSDDNLNSTDNNQVSWLVFPLIISMFLFVSIIVEKKFLHNHYVRLFVPFSMALSVGIYRCYQSFISNKKYIVSHKPILLALIVSIPILIIISPLSRVMHVSNPTLLRLLSKDKYEEYVNRLTQPGFEIGSVNSLKKILVAKGKPNDKTLVAGVTAEIVYQQIGEPVWSAFGYSQFYHAVGVNPRWVNLFQRDVRNADWIFILDDDNYMDTNGHPNSTWVMMQKDTVVMNYLENHFVLDTMLGKSKLFHRVR
jgi:4-amino-4-deoxy-L-arabinose transferase-like glycosyltransferase